MTFPVQGSSWGSILINSKKLSGPVCYQWLKPSTSFIQYCVWTWCTSFLCVWNWGSWAKILSYQWSHPKCQQLDPGEIVMSVIYLWWYGFIPILLYISTETISGVLRWRNYPSGFKSCFNDLSGLWSWIYYSRPPNLGFLFYKVMIIILLYKQRNCSAKWDNLYKVPSSMMNTS